MNNRLKSVEVRNFCWSCKQQISPFDTFCEVCEKEFQPIIDAMGSLLDAFVPIVEDIVEQICVPIINAFAEFIKELESYPVPHSC